MHRRHILALAATVCVAPRIEAAPKLTNFRFGILRVVSKDIFEFASETRLIPKRTKRTGFRFGVGFDNPQGESIEWYEIIHLPATTRDVSGNFQRTSAQDLRTKTFRSNRPSIVDDFWFDDGDPLGGHTLELFVNGVVRFTVDFEVVKDK